MNALRSLALAVLLGMLAAAGPARADTAMALYKSFSGNVNFTGTQVTIRDRGYYASACKVSSESTVQSASLSLPRLSTVVSAQLYWAGSGNVDSTVAMNGKAVAASRSFTSPTIGQGLNYFSAAADVTDRVKLKGSGTYTFSGLKVSNGSPWCERSAVLGGYALVVVYANTNETYRTLNLYEGFRALLQGEVRLDMANFRVPDNVSSSALGRFGHLVWEGDAAISREGEALFFNNVSLTQSTYAPSGNNFNSKSSINADERSLGIDFDAYSLGPWPAKLNTVSALFRTGGDMVLLNAAMLAVPSTPAADLSIDLVRNTELRNNTTITYTATVSNAGPGTETGPFDVKLALPAGMAFSSGSGKNWTCSGLGTAATCTYKGSLDKGASTVLTLKAVVSSSGSKTVSVSVAGNNDPATSNNQDSDTGTVAGASGVSFEYTQRACTAGELVGPGGTCPLFAGPVVAGASASIFLTAVDSANKARIYSSTASTPVTLYAALGCVNPASSAGNVKATYGLAATPATLPACSADAAVAVAASTNTGVWTATTRDFAANKASIDLRFVYPEAGAVKLYVRTTSGATDFVEFVSVPDRLAVTVKNAEGQQPKTGNVGLGQNGFVRAGEYFTVQVTALSTDGKELKNFGKETGELQRPVLVNTITRLDTPAAGAAEIDNAELDGGYQASGLFTGSFRWSDIGSFTLRVDLDNYLGAELSAFGTVAVGRVYPAYFSTVATPAFACLARMNCPDGADAGLAKVSGAVHSREPFGVTVLAHDENGSELKNFNTALFPALVPTLSLTAVDKPGGQAFGDKVKPGGLADVAAKTTARNVSFGLGTAFDAAAKRTAWLAPTAVYLRATADDYRAATLVKLSSLQETAPESGDTNESQEGGVMVINGRLGIGNAIGSELLRTPVAMTAQFWNGSNWENNTSVSYASLLHTDQARFTRCQKTLRDPNKPEPDNCKTALLKTAASGALAISAGTAKYLLAPVGAGQSGSVRIQMQTPAWLPSMLGQVTLGARKSPVIYIREMY